MLTNITETNKKAWAIEEISAQTSLSKAFLRLEIKRGKLKAKYFGRRVLVLDADLQAYLQGGKDDGSSAIAA